MPAVGEGSVSALFRQLLRPTPGQVMHLFLYRGRGELPFAFLVLEKILLFVVPRSVASVVLLPTLLCVGVNFATAAARSWSPLGSSAGVVRQGSVFACLRWQCSGPSPSCEVVVVEGVLPVSERYLGQAVV